jgi:hypothetical protein
MVLLFDYPTELMFLLLLHCFAHIHIVTTSNITASPEENHFDTLYGQPSALLLAKRK